MVRSDSRGRASWQTVGSSAPFRSEPAHDRRLGGGGRRGGVPLRQLIVENARVWSDTTRPARPLSPPAATRLSAIAAPTLVLVGERDGIDVHRIAELIARNAQRASVDTIAGAGHMLNFAAPERFRELVTRFMRD